MKSLKFILSFLVIFTGWAAYSQTYPVQVHVIHNGPDYNYLSYYADQNQHLQFYVTLTDFNAQPEQVKLRVKIDGPGYSLRTKQNLDFAPSITLTPGLTEVISSFDLAPYLAENNLDISPSNFDINRLPEGITTVCVDIIRDGINQEVLSTNNCTNFNLIKFQPPQAFFPVCEGTVNPEEMFYTFQWTSPVGYFPTTETQLNYTFSLYEWTDPNNYSIFQTGQGLVYTTTSQQPMVQLSKFDVMLQEGMQYVWRVQADITTNTGQTVDMFNNNGLSEICTFTYGEVQTLEETLAEGLTINLTTSGESERKGRASWTVIDNTPSEGLSTFSEFLVQYRKKPTGNEDFELTWFEDTVSGFSQFIHQLEAETTYEVKVSGIVNGFITEPSEVSEFRTAPPRNYACGDADMPFMSEQFVPLADASIGMRFQIGQFNIILGTVENNGNGRFSGMGLVPIKFLLNLPVIVEFDNILVDNNYNVREGVVEVKTKGLDNWLHTQYSNFVDPIYVDGTVDSAYVDGGVAWAVIDGTPQSWEFDPPDYPIVIRDEDGTEYKIMPDGEVIITSFLAVVGEWNVEEGETVQFEQAGNEVYGFDKKEYAQWIENYDVYKLNEGKNYFVAHKSIGQGQQDFVNVSNPTVGNLSDITFKLDGTTTLTRNGNTLTIPAINSGKNHEIVALKNGQQVGKLDVFMYAPKDKKVIVVPLVSSTLSKGAIESEIQNTLGEANLAVDVEVKPQWNDDVFTSSKTITLPEDIGLMGKFSDEMRQLRTAYFDAHETESGATYLFVVPGFDDATVDGYMVRGRALGFIAANADAHTYAHELAHGLGALEHTWQGNGPPQGSTNNLMDYNGGNNLTQKQWKELRDLDIAPNLWDDEEDYLYGFDEVIQFWEGEKVETPLTNEQKNMGFVFLNGHRYKFNQSDDITSVVFDKYGRVYSFKVGTTEYQAYILINTDTKDYLCPFYVSKSTYEEYKSKVYDYNTNMNTEEWNYLLQNRYVFSECQENEQCFRRSIVYRHSGIYSAPNLWKNESCLVEDIFLNPEHTPVSGYVNGIYLGPSFRTNNFTVINGSEEECWFPPEVTGLDETGVGAGIFYELSKDITPTNSDSLAQLVDLANYFSELGENEVRTFYDYETNSFSYFGNLHSGNTNLTFNGLGAIPVAFKRDDIYSVSSYKQTYDKSNWFFARGKDSIISKVNIRSDIPSYYNANSIDYTSFDIPSFKTWTCDDTTNLKELINYLESLYNQVSTADPAYANTQNMQHTYTWIQNVKADYLAVVTGQKLPLRYNVINILNTLGAFDKYEYSVLDLIAREKLKRDNGGDILTAVLSSESEGRAQPLNMSEGYQQYINHHDTESAFFLGFEYMKMYVDNFFEPAALIQVIAKAKSIRNIFKSHKNTRPKNLDDIFKGGAVNLANAGGNLSHFLDDAFVISKRAEVVNSTLPSQFPSLSIDELTAIKVYTSDEVRNGVKIYSELNSQLRSGNLDDYYQGLNQLLNDGLGKMTQHNGNLVFRGCGQAESQLAKTWNVGDEITFKDFKSSSVNEGVAENFMNSGGGDVIYEISNPKGYNICDISCSPNEAEIFFKSGSKFRVDELTFQPRFTESDPIIRVIKLTYIP